MCPAYMGAGSSEPGHGTHYIVLDAQHDKVPCRQLVTTSPNYQPEHKVTWGGRITNNYSHRYNLRLVIHALVDN